MSDRDPDWLESEAFDVDRDSRQSRRPPRWWPVLPAVLVALLALILTVQKPSDPLSEPVPMPRPTTFSPPLISQPAIATSISASAPSPDSAQTAAMTRSTDLVTVQVANATKNLWGVTGNWEVFTVGPGGVVRIQPAAGITTVTQPLDLPTKGTDKIIALQGTAWVFQPNGGQGYQVRDGHQASPLPAGLTGGGLTIGIYGSAVQGVIAGPDQGRVWVQHTDYQSSGRSTVLLTTLAGRVERRVTLPGGARAVGPDGRGGVVIVNDSGGIYRLVDSGYQRLSVGTLLALGPRRALVSECDDEMSCALKVLDLSTGTRRPVPASPGIVVLTADLSADGTMAALAYPGVDGRSMVALMDLDSGRRKALHLSADGQVINMVFSPDSQLLFVVDNSYQLSVFDRSGRRLPLQLDLPRVESVAVRAGLGDTP